MGKREGGEKKILWPVSCVLSNGYVYIYIYIVEVKRKAVVKGIIKIISRVIVQPPFIRLSHFSPSLFYFFPVYFIIARPLSLSF